MDSRCRELLVYIVMCEILDLAVQIFQGAYNLLRSLFSVYWNQCAMWSIGNSGGGYYQGAMEAFHATICFLSSLAIR